MKKIINLTAHNVNIVCSNGDVITFSPSGTVARCTQTTTQIGCVNGIPLTQTSFGVVVDLPQPQEDTIFIVSRLVLNACKGVRDDLIVPNDIVRDEQGNIIGCKSFAIN